MIRTTAKALPQRQRVRLRECPPSAIVAPLADLDDDNVASIYMLPYAGPLGGHDGAVSNDTAATVATPAEASGADLPASGVNTVGPQGGGGSSGLIGVPPGFGGGGSSGGGVPGGGGIPGVPEPATWGLMLIGLGAIGGHLRRARSGAISA